tara:strand:- start:3192 stop:3620 length:429 start_codon:yes stop_codon:yes gene_type:complete
MIKYNLKCHNNHEFESWFSDSSEFDKLNKKALLECIFCDSKKISKTIMAPMVSVVKGKEDKIDLIKINKKIQNEKKELLKIRKFIENNFEFVGNNFSKKVREIYYDKKSKKTIYGSTTVKERAELAEEGIEILSLPWINKDN